MSYPRITSRKNQIITELKLLSGSKKRRDETGEFLLDGLKLLSEAIDAKAEITKILWCEKPSLDLDIKDQYTAPKEILEYVSQLNNTDGPIFTVKKPVHEMPERITNAIILENIQDPGNVGTALRTASALGIDLVFLVGACADPYSMKAIRSSMGACFKQKIIISDRDFAVTNLRSFNVPIYAATLCDDSVSIRDISLKNCAVAIGNEGGGLSDELINECDAKIIIPMQEGNESLNASAAAAIIMWEMSKQ